jgi:hypothetical protein
MSLELRGTILQGRFALTRIEGQVWQLAPGGDG